MHPALQGDPRDPQAVARAAQRLQQGSRSWGGTAAPVNLHGRSDSACILIRSKHRGGGEVCLMNGAAHQDHASDGVSPFRLAPFRRVPARRDLHRVSCPWRLLIGALVEAPGLDRSGIGQERLRGRHNGLDRLGTCLLPSRRRHDLHAGTAGGSRRAGRRSRVTPVGPLRRAHLSVAAPLRGRPAVLGLELLNLPADGKGVEVDNSFFSLHVLFGPLGPRRRQGVRRETLRGCNPQRRNAAAPSLVPMMAARVAGALPVAGR